MNWSRSREEQLRTVKKVCRYQQFTAVNKILKRVTEEEEKRGIIWHWQGSSKSLTMLFAAVKLRREEKKLKNPIILVVTDRIDLDDQISKTFRNCSFPNPIQIRETRSTHRKLYELLSHKVGNTILATVHLFRKPLDKRGRNTYRHFSPPGERYLDAYTIRKAEEDQWEIGQRK